MTRRLRHLPALAALVILAGCAATASPATESASVSPASPTSASPLASSSVAEPVAYCADLARASSMPDPQGATLTPEEVTQRQAYTDALNSAADAAQRAGRLDVAVFLSLSAKVRSDPAGATRAQLTRLQELSPTVQATIDADCPRS